MQSEWREREDSNKQLEQLQNDTFLSISTLTIYHPQAPHNQEAWQQIWMLFYPNNAAQDASNILPFGEIVGVVPSSHPTSGSSFVRWLVQRKYLIPHTTSLVNNLGDDVTDAIDNSEVDTKGGDGSGQGTQMSTCSSSIQADVTGTTTTRKRKRGDAFSDTLSSRKGNDAESQDSQVVHHVSSTDLMITFKKICCPSNANRIASPPLSPQSSDSESSSDTGAHEGSDDSDSE